MSPRIEGPYIPPLQQIAPDPAPVQPGTAEYYQQRVEDFQRRNPGMDPPDYYLGYGQKYMERFTSLDGTDLSADGLAWRDRTTLALQQAIEDYRIRDPEGFAELERDPEKFREFAFGTHPDAYVDSGLFDLPVQDLLVIAATPDIGDVLSGEGIKQTITTILMARPQDIPEVLVDTAKQYVRDAGLSILTPWGPAVAGSRQMERLLDRVFDQDWALPNISFPKIDLLPGIDLPDVDLPDIDLPDIDLPDVDLPDIDLPDIDLPDVDLPDVNLPKLPWQ